MLSIVCQGFIILNVLTHQTSTPQNGRKHSNNPSAFADELFECFLPFWRTDASRVKKSVDYLITITDNGKIISTSIFD